MRDDSVPRGVVECRGQEMPAAGSAAGDKLSMFRTMPECLQDFETPRSEESEEDMLRNSRTRWNGKG